MRRVKNKKGITLIALIITIIVLLILAGVTISAVIGDDGIIKKAAEAKVQMEKSKKDEVLNLLIELPFFVPIPDGLYTTINKEDCIISICFLQQLKKLIIKNPLLYHLTFPKKKFQE